MEMCISSYFDTLEGSRGKPSFVSSCKFDEKSNISCYRDNYQVISMLIYYIIFSQSLMKQQSLGSENPAIGFTLHKNATSSTHGFWCWSTI